ncbi:uncharacterized protein EI90DRAFT_2515877 [Cantharellus anzutake]|uniref:uncharacterized protein n=1 Tax=Cantharellus anzutake TaxID=1750568 RepID=UPI0019038F45|nr:uncharacterized protein EI90DRAFT_2515877 [Cantharellus anzutake]KAF8337872.1 hypothetical protein EI90DRAFT_2515877 [Cantharellus anzutake]
MNPLATRNGCCAALTLLVTRLFFLFFGGTPVAFAGKIAWGFVGEGWTFRGGEVDASVLVQRLPPQVGSANQVRAW